MTARATLLLAALALAGCDGLPRFDDAPPPLPPSEADADAALIGLDLGGEEVPVVADLDPFDRAEGEAALALARQAEADGRTEEAAAQFRRAAIAWPDLVEAWRGLARTARAAGNGQEAAAARFVANRVDLYPAEDMGTQRDTRFTLIDWIDTHRDDPMVGDLTLAYADTLTAFWATLYRARGDYEPPARFLNVRRIDLPAVLLTGGGAAWYAFSLVGS